MDAVVAADGYGVPLRRYAADGSAQGNIILLPALGMQARYYDRLAAALAARGFNVALMELRGHGDSAVRASRRVDFGFREMLELDLPAVMQAVARQWPAQPLLMVGHSLGGHYAVMAAGRYGDAVAGVVAIACGSPWLQAFTGTQRRRLRLLVTMMPLLNALVGHYPGDRVGFGGREARRLMREWREMARHNRYRAEGLDHDLDAGIAAFQGHVLALTMADDDYAPAAAVAAVTDKFHLASVTRCTLTAAELGVAADHFRWARSPERVAEAVLEWWVRARQRQCR